MGATGIRVSEIGFGSGDNAGLLVKGEPEVQIRAIERALELGINYFDTSPDYGKGLAETNIGKAMREIGFRPVIATKVEIMPDELDHIADAVVESLEESLERLQVDYVDVLQIHNPPSIETDTTVPGWLHLGLEDYLGAGGAMEGMERLRRAGKTRFLRVRQRGRQRRRGDGADGDGRVPHAERVVRPAEPDCGAADAGRSGRAARLRPVPATGAGVGHRDSGDTSSRGAAY